MGKVKRMAMAAVAAVVGLACIYLVVRVAANLMQGYTWEEMDWKQSGRTSLGDFFAASEVGKREIEQDGRKCIEYFSYKDGLPVKVVCSKGKSGSDSN